MLDITCTPNTAQTGVVSVGGIVKNNVGGGLSPKSLKPLQKISGDTLPKSGRFAILGTH